MNSEVEDGVVVRPAEERMRMMFDDEGRVAGVSAVVPPPIPADGPAAEVVDAVQHRAPLGGKRLAIRYGPSPEHYVLCIEQAPEWDTMGRPFRMEKETVKAVLPLLEKLDVRLKIDVDDLIEEEDEEPEHPPLRVVKPRSPRRRA